jgi:autotransporter-associated beta strand protein
MVTRLSLCLLVLLLVLAPQQMWATDKWFDANGTTAGGGDPCSANVSGGAFWSSSDAGTDPAVWVTGDIAHFSAGTPANTTATCNSSITVGGIIVEDGKVVVGGSAALVAGAGPITVNSGATLSTNNSSRISTTAGSVYTLNGGTLECTNSGAAGSFVDIDSTIVLNGGGTFRYTAAGVLNIVQPTTTVSGTGPLTKTGAGILAIAADCTYTGDTIVNEGTLRMRTTSNLLPTGTNLIINNPGIFDPAVNQSVRTVNGDGKITYSGSGTLTISGSTGYASVISGVISDGASYGKLTKSGAGTLTLSAANTYDGTFTNSAGTTTVTATGKLIGAAGDVVVNGGTLNLNNTAQTIENLSGSGGTINLASGHTLTTAAAGNTAYAGSIAGDGGLAIANAYTLALSGINTYTGGTAVNAGTLEVGGSIKGSVTVAAAASLKLDNAAALDTAATLTLADVPAAGTVNLSFIGAQSILGLNFGATAQALGTWGALGSGAIHESAAFTGTGLLLVNGGDTEPPTISIGAASETSTASGPVTYEITYGGADAITLADGDVTLNKTDTADASSVVVSGSGLTTRTVTISGITGNGTLGISIAAGTANDLVGNPAPAAGPSATFDVSGDVSSYGLSNKAVADPLIADMPAETVFTVWGKVTTYGDPNSFYLDDGSSKPIKVLFTGHGLADDDYASARGTLDLSGAEPVMTASMVKKQN